MTRTSPLTVVLAWLGAAAVGFAVDTALVGNGRPMLPLPISVGLMLAATGIVVVLAAWPVRRMVRGGRKVGFRHAMRVLAFAKASSLVAALGGGWASGTLLFLVTRPVLSMDALTTALVTLGGGTVLLVAGLLAESWCVLPPDDDAASPA